MKLYLNNGNVFEIDNNTKLELLNTDEFVSVIKRESSFIPAGHIKVELKYNLICNENKYSGESIFDSNKGITNNIDVNAPYKIELVNWKLSDNEEKYLEFNFVKKDNRIVEITRDNYKNFDWDENVKYQYRGLLFKCDHEYDAGVFMIWLELPSGIYDVFKEKNIPYKHQFEAGLMYGENLGPHFLTTIVELMDYVDEYYEYFESKINNLEK